ncbi:hypothetical protein Tco_0588585 [Tanacetum coccineum]
MRCHSFRCSPGAAVVVVPRVSEWLPGGRAFLTQVYAASPGLVVSGIADVAASVAAAAAANVIDGGGCGGCRGCGG